MSFESKRMSNSAVSLLFRRRKHQAFVNSVDESMSRALVLYNHPSTNETNPPHNSSASTPRSCFAKPSILNLNLSLPSKSDRLDQIKQFFEMNQLKIDAKQVKLKEKEKTRVKSVEHNHIKRAERKGLIKIVPAVAYCQAIESVEAIQARQLREKAIEEASYIVSDQFLASDMDNRKLAEKNRLQIEELKRKKSQQLKALIQQENIENDEKIRQKKIQDANRQRQIEEKAKVRAIRQAKAKAAEETRLAEEKRELLREIELARIRDEEMAKIRMTEEVKRCKRLADSQSAIQSSQAQAQTSTTASVQVLERKLSLKVKSKLDIVMDKNLIKEEIRAARELDQRLLEEKVCKVAEEKAKRDSMVHSKYSNYNIDYLKDRYLIKERRIIEENEKIEQFEMAKQKARERERIKSRIQAQYQAELESTRIVNETARLNDEQQAAQIKILEEQTNAKLRFETLTNCNHRYLIDDIEKTATLRAIENVKHEMTINPDQKLDVFKEKAIKTAMKQATVMRRPTTGGLQMHSNKIKSKANLKLTRSFVVPSSVSSQATLVQPGTIEENTKIKAALSYLASIEDFLLEQQMINNPLSSSSTSSTRKYGSTGEYLNERRRQNDLKLNQQKLKVEEENAKRLRAQERARKRLQTDVRKQVESEDGDLFYDNYRMESFFDKF